MSQENVELVSESIERFNSGDIEGMLAMLAPEIRFEHRIAALEGSFTGVDAVRRWFADLAQHFDNWRIECDDIRDLGDRVLALGTLWATGKGSGVEADVPYTALAEISGGLIARFTDYGDREKALEAAGLSEENVEVIRKLYEYQRDPEKFLELFDPDVVWINVSSAIETRPFHGHEGIREWASGYMTTLRDFRMELTEIIDAGGDQVVSVQRVLGTGMTSGVPVEHELSCLFTLLNGKIVRGQGFRTRAEALQAAGLPE